MKSIVAHIYPAFVCLLFVGCGCGQEKAPAPLPDVKSESVIQTLQDQQRAQDSLPRTEVDKAHDQEIIDRVNRSGFKHLSDAQLEAQVRGWVAHYRATCDPQVYDSCKKALSDDPVFQAWRGKNSAVSRALMKTMKAVQDSCSRQAGTP